MSCCVKIWELKKIKIPLQWRLSFSNFDQWPILIQSKSTRDGKKITIHHHFIVWWIEIGCIPWKYNFLKTFFSLIFANAFSSFYSFTFLFAKQPGRAFIIIYYTINFSLNVSAEPHKTTENIQTFWFLKNRKTLFLLKFLHFSSKTPNTLTFSISDGF